MCLKWVSPSSFTGARMCHTQSSFQVFVANPKKPPQIEIILRRNKEKLLNFLKTFHNDKEGACYSFLFSFLALDISSSSTIDALHIFPFLFLYKLQLMTFPRR